MCPLALGGVNALPRLLTPAGAFAFTDCLDYPMLQKLGGLRMPIVDLLAGAASFAAVVGGLIGRSYLSAVDRAIVGFILIFLYSAALGAAFPMGIAHLIGASFLGLLGYAIQGGLYRGKPGRNAWGVVTGCMAASIIVGGLIALLSGERKSFRGLLTAVTDYQDERFMHAKAMLRGEAALPILHEWRALAEASINATLSVLMAKPFEYAGTINGYALNYAETGQLGFRDNGVYRFGVAVRSTIMAAFPGDPARKYEFSHMLVQGW